MAPDRVYSSSIHFMVLVCSTAQKHMLLGKILVHGVGHAADCEPVVRELLFQCIYRDGPQPWQFSCILCLIKEIRNPLDGVKVFRISGQLGQTGKFQI